MYAISFPLNIHIQTHTSNPSYKSQSSSPFAGSCPGSSTTNTHIQKVRTECMELGVERTAPLCCSRKKNGSRRASTSAGSGAIQGAETPHSLRDNWLVWGGGKESGGRVGCGARLSKVMNQKHGCPFSTGNIRLHKVSQCQTVFLYLWNCVPLLLWMRPLTGYLCPWTVKTFDSHDFFLMVFCQHYQRKKK